jgi:uncharacterized 2Fe-2S/4Fe-4S cluster protein (DUF4445 family)
MDAKGAAVKKNDYTITFQPVGTRVRCSGGESVLQAARRAGIHITAVCAGEGYCGKCRVQVVKGEVSGAEIRPVNLLSEAEWGRGVRLACRIFPRSDLTVFVPSESFDALQRLQVDCKAFEMTLQPQQERDFCHGGGLGLAVDLGTTKIAGYLVDLGAGRVVSQAAVANGQVVYGEDIISRIAASGRDARAEGAMRDAAVDSINALVEELCGDTWAPGDIGCGVIAGNTVMQHLLLGLPVRQLGLAPYEPARKAAITVCASEAGLTVGEQAGVYFPPNIAGYIGGDHAAALCAAELFGRAGTCMLCDVGTNTEISLLHDGVIRSCSCASGPAFEGAHIRQGLRAAAGAIEHVSMRGGALECSVIGGGDAVGICGSGLVDAVAALQACGALSRQGGLDRQHRLVREFEGQAAVELTDSVLLTQRDISVLQLAKGAIRAGFALLMEDAGIGPDELDLLLLAGAFGTYIDVASAVRVNMLPPIEPGILRQIGNAAGLGAVRLLVDEQARRTVENGAALIRHIDLTAAPLFSQVLARSMFF